MTTSNTNINKDQQELRIARNLLESPGWEFGSKVIEQIPNQTIEQATKKLIRTLPEAERTKLRNIVDWVVDYEKNDKRDYLGFEV